MVDHRNNNNTLKGDDTFTCIGSNPFVWVVLCLYKLELLWDILELSEKSCFDTTNFSAKWFVKNYELKQI